MSIGALEVRDMGTAAERVWASCSGCGKTLVAARSGAGVVAVVADQLDAAGAIVICGNCVSIIAGAVRNPTDPHQHDAAAQLLTSALGCSTEARHRAADRK